LVWAMDSAARADRYQQSAERPAAIKRLRQRSLR
jgi:hypothetical protein